MAQGLIDSGVRVRTLTRRPAGGNSLGGRVEEAPMEFSDPDGAAPLAIEARSRSTVVP